MCQKVSVHGYEERAAPRRSKIKKPRWQAKEQHSHRAILICWGMAVLRDAGSSQAPMSDSGFLPFSLSRWWWRACALMVNNTFPCTILSLLNLLEMHIHLHLEDGFLGLEEFFMMDISSLALISAYCNLPMSWADQEGKINPQVSLPIWPIFFRSHVCAQCDLLGTCQDKEWPTRLKVAMFLFHVGFFYLV